MKRKISRKTKLSKNVSCQAKSRFTRTLKEEKFYASLKDVFVGAKVEGDSGYINLMRIKSRYYTEGIFPILKKSIEEALKPYPEFREEVFDKLYTFFNRYFSESGSIYFRYTPLHQNVYERVYTDDKDVMLFWKTHMLYYVKTDRLFKNLEVELDGVRFFFDVSTLEHKRANEKRKIIYWFKEKRRDGVLVFSVAYSEKGRKIKIVEILKTLRKEDVKIDEEVLEKAFRIFERQSEVDYFINKNARAFLQEQFNLWLYQYVFSGESEWTETRIKQLQTLKDAAFKIIDFISQFEDELVKIWNKPKFVLNSNYVITLDRIANPSSSSKEKGIKLLEKLLKHKNFKSQVQEWSELGIIEKGFKKNDVIKKNKGEKDLNDKWRYLPLDTKHFKDLELEIVGLFDNLDESLDGWLIKSENYQALNTLLPKFNDRVKSMYIDPPFNSPASEIIYENKYKSSSWLTMIQNRLFLGRQMLNEEGVLCVAIDDHEFHRVISLIEEYYPQSLGVVVARSNPAGRSSPKGFSLAHEYAVFAAKTEVASIGRLERSQKQIDRYKEKDDYGLFEWVNFRKHGGLRIESPKMFYPIYGTASSIRIPDMTWNEERQEWVSLEKPHSDEQVIWPIDENGQERRWKWGPERLVKNITETKVDYDRRGLPAVYIKSRLPAEGITPISWWDKKEYSATDYGTRSLKDIFGQHGLFSYPKSPKLVEDCLRVASLGETGITFDFFAGSGTTAHAVINLNRQDGGRRKYIMVEMADYFDTVMLPRIKKVVFSDEWKNGKAQNGEGISHFVKYYELEQYEDTLRKVKYDDAGLFENPYQDPYSQYVFMRDLKMLEALEVDVKENRVKVDLAKLYENIDIAETLSNIRGKWVKRIAPDSLEFEDGEKVDIKNLDYRLIKPLIWW